MSRPAPRPGARAVRLLLWCAASLVLHGFLLFFAGPPPLPRLEQASEPVQVGLVSIPPRRAAPSTLPEPSPFPAETTTPEPTGSRLPDPVPPLNVPPPAQDVPPSLPVPKRLPQERPAVVPEPATPSPQISAAAATPPQAQPAPEEVSPIAPSQTSVSRSFRSETLPETGHAPRSAPLVEASPRYESNAPPSYPRAARLRGWEGEVLLRVTVAADGRPRSVNVARSSGYDLLDRAAERAVRGWRFEPARRGNEPVIDDVIVPLRFELRR